MLSLFNIRQSAAEILACVAQDLFPGIFLIEGKATEFGFYYDFIASQPIDDYALVLLEEKMRGVVKENPQVRTLEMMRENAANLLEHHEQPYRADNVRAARDNIVTIMQIGKFHDYCPFPHIVEICGIGAFKLLSVERIQKYLPEVGSIEVVRIHGTSFHDKAALKKYVKAWTASQKIDHRKLVKKEQNPSFILEEEVNSHSWCWLGKGEAIREKLRNAWVQECRKFQYQVVETPVFVKKSLIDRAGLGEESAIPTFLIEGIEYSIATSKSPAHAVLFASKNRSQADLPLRFAECSLTYPQQRGGQLWGVFNSAPVSSDQVNIFCASEQVETEIISSLQFIDKIIKIFSFECHWHLKGRGQRSAGTDSSWNKGIDSLRQAFDKSGVGYLIDAKDGVYSGPTAQAYLIDKVGREWEGPAISIDFNIPERFKLRYMGADGKMRPPIMLTTEVYGSIERFAALLVEQC